MGRARKLIPMPIRSVTPSELKDLLVRHPDLPLVDVRSPSEYRAVHVTGATNLPLDQLSAARLDSVLSQRDDGIVYFICKGGVRSRNACQKAQHFGLSEVVNVDGGTDACVAAGLHVDRGSGAAVPGRRIRIAAGLAFLVGAVLMFAAHPLWAGASILVGAALIFSGIVNA